MAFHLGWIDFSKEERDKALDILRLLQDPGAVDELGIGIVRDAFADAFFPGTSTLLTRAKYFVVVPYIIQETIEECGRSSLTARQTLEAINKEERRFGERMLEKHKGDRTVGIVGSTALSQGRWVRRSPSELYWNGIRTLGICKNKGLSLLQYVSAGLESCRARGRTLGTFKRGEADEGDDLDAGGMLGFKPLDIGAIHKKGWMKDADISLTNDEAVYLREKILSNVGGSLFAAALENDVDLMKYCGDFIAFAEDMSRYVDGRTRHLLELACYFSRVVYAGRVRYNIMLQGDRSNEARECWETFIHEGIPKESRMEEVLETLQIQGASFQHNSTAGFLQQLAVDFHGRDWERMDALIKKREKAIKGPERAKLFHAEKYPATNWIGGRFLDYRLPDTARIVADIYEGLGAANV